MKKIISLLLTIFVFATCLTCPVAFAAEDVIGELEIEYVSRRSYTVSADITANTGRDYTFVAASYGEGNTLVGAERVDVAAPAQGTETTISASFDLSAKSYVKDTKYTKFLLWDMDEIEPLATAVTENYEAVDVAQGKTTGGKSSENQFYGISESGAAANVGGSAAYLVDGNIDTNVGFFGNNFGLTGHMYIDLGAKYKIDRIDILAYNASYAGRAGDFDLVVSNSVTNGSACTDANKVTVAHVPNATATTAASAEYQSFYMPAGSTEYQYVSLEKFQTNDFGLLIAEVKVYVLEEDMPEPEAPVTYIDVTKINGVVTGAAYNPNGNNAYNPIDHLPHSRLIDGNETDGAGFYYNVRTGYMYIDLRREYKIHHIEVVAYDSMRPMNCSNYNLIVTNTLPDLTPYDAQNPGTDLLVATPEYDANATTAANGTKTFNLPETDNSYRYVSFEQLTDKGDKFGLVIQEVRVFVNEADVPEGPLPVLTNVALGKIGSANSANNLTSYPYSAVTDGFVCVGGNSQQFIGGSNGGIFFLDLGAVYSIEKIMLDCVSKDFSSNTSVYVSNEPITEATIDSITKTTLLEATSTSWDAATKTVNVSPSVSGRYIAVRRVGTGNQLRIGELEVWGVPAQ